jgi:hypothetical protein
VRSDYALRRNPALPWGYWLRVVPGGLPLEDEHGRRWLSVRECFWTERLAMPVVPGSVRDEQLELMLGVLLSAGYRQLPGGATAHDMFERSRVFFHHYMPWLVSAGLMEVSSDGDGLTGKVGDEGHAVTLMLIATRPRELGGTPIAPAAYEILRALDGVVGPGASRMAAVEALARRQSHAFLREVLAGRPGISLVVRDGAGLMPFSRTVWSQAFSDEDSRDWFYVWLCDRVDRWDAWAVIAWRKGGQVLTQHLLATLVADGFGVD